MDGSSSRAVGRGQSPAINRLLSSRAGVAVFALIYNPCAAGALARKGAWARQLLRRLCVCIYLLCYDGECHVLLALMI